MTDMSELLNVFSGLGGVGAIAASITILLRLWAIKWVREGVFRWIGKLPKEYQAVPPFLIAMAIAGLEGWQTGLRGWKLVSAVAGAGTVTAAVAIGFHHIAKRAWLWFCTLSGKIKLLLASLLLLTGCAGSFEEARLAGAQDRLAGAKVNPARCASLDSRHAWGGAVAVGAASLAGVSGLATVRVDDDDRELRYGLAVGSVGAAALAVGAEAYSRSAATSYARECLP